MANNSFRFEIPNSYSRIPDKIGVIKALRMLTGMGLKDAKDASERPGEQEFDISSLNFSVYPAPEIAIEDQFRILRNNGCRVGDPVNKIFQSLRDLASDALKQGDDELANEILQLVLAEKLRRIPSKS